MKPGTEQGKRLSARDRRQIRAELLAVAHQTGNRAYTFRFDGDKRVEFRAFPDGRTVSSEVTEKGVSVEPQRRLLAAGLPARYVGVAGGLLLIAADVVSRLVT